MIYRESGTVELKQMLADSVKKEIIAFANSAGGTLYIGIADTGDIVGVENPDATVQQLSNMVRDSIKPDVTMFIHYDIIDIEGKPVITASVQRGTERPYYLSGKGLRPEGVYVRQGASSVPASKAAIRRMIIETDGDNYEDMRSLTQELTFESAKAEFEERGIALGIPQMRTLGLINPDGLYTNLALLLSEQCLHSWQISFIALD